MKSSAFELTLTGPPRCFSFFDKFGQKQLDLRQLRLVDGRILWGWIEEHSIDGLITAVVDLLG